MKLDKVVGQASRVEFLKRMANSGVSRSYFFYGPEGSGKNYVARLFAEDIAGDANDVRVMKSGSSVEDVRQVVAWMEKAPYCGALKAIVLRDVERLSSAAANAALKSIEESKGVWILTSSHPRLVLDTLKSRCFSVRFSEYSEAELFAIARLWKYIETDARVASVEAKGSVVRLRRILEGEVDDVEELCFAMIDSVKKKNLGRLMKEMKHFRGAGARDKISEFFDVLIYRGIQERWSAEALEIVFFASRKVEQGNSPHLVVANMFLELGSVIQ